MRYQLRYVRVMPSYFCQFVRLAAFRADWKNSSGAHPSPQTGGPHVWRARITHCRALRRRPDIPCRTGCFTVIPDMELFSPELERLAATRAAIMMEQLETLNAYLPGGEWAVDLENCVFSMGNAELRCSLLGSYAAHNASFLWSWGNPGYGPEHIATQSVLRLTDIGRIWEIPELTCHQLDLSTKEDPVMCAVSTFT